MKRKILALTMAMLFAAASIGGCGNKETPSQSQEQEAATEVSEVTAEASAEVQEQDAAAEASSEEENQNPEITASLDEAIAQGILLCNNNLFKAGETSGEGHILMGQDDADADGNIKCYCLEMFGAYEFQDGNFVKCAGTGAIPCVITVKQNDDGTYEFISMVEADDGSSFVDSIKKNFPEALWSRCITIDPDDSNELEKQERAYAEEYVSSIGREDAEVGDYSDYDHKLLTDEGVSVEVSNKMIDVQSGDGFEFFCPMWIGEREVLDDNVRYVYKTEYDKKKQLITFSKTDYESGEVLETASYSAKTGEKTE